LEKRHSQTSSAGKTSRLKHDPYLMPCAIISTKWINDLDLRPETLKLL
jgi:hypothetical protein